MRLCHHSREPDEPRRKCHSRGTLLFLPRGPKPLWWCKFRITHSPPPKLFSPRRISIAAFPLTTPCTMTFSRRTFFCPIDGPKKPFARRHGPTSFFQISRRPPVEYFFHPDQKYHSPRLVDLTEQVHKMPASIEISRTIFLQDHTGFCVTNPTDCFSTSTGPQGIRVTIPLGRKITCGDGTLPSPPPHSSHCCQLPAGFFAKSIDRTVRLFPKCPSPDFFCQRVSLILDQQFLHMSKAHIRKNARASAISPSCITRQPKAERFPKQTSQGRHPPPPTRTTFPRARRAKAVGDPRPRPDFAPLSRNDPRPRQKITSPSPRITKPESSSLKDQSFFQKNRSPASATISFTPALPRSINRLYERPRIFPLQP